MELGEIDIARHNRCGWQADAQKPGVSLIGQGPDQDTRETGDACLPKRFDDITYESWRRREPGIAQAHDKRTAFAETRLRAPKRLDTFGDLRGVLRADVFRILARLRGPARTCFVPFVVPVLAAL